MRYRLSLTALLCLASQLVAGPLTTGNLTISRTGDGTTAIGSSAMQVTLVEVRTDGTTTGNTVPLPTQATANAGGLTDSGSASSSGHLNRTADGRYLVLTGYDAPLGTASVTSTTSLLVNRPIARVDGAGAASIVARLADAFSANNARSATSDIGSTFYAAGNPGVRWVDASSSVPTTSTAIVASSSHRDVLIAQDVAGAKFLVVSTNTGISAFTGFPTATAAPTSLGITLTDPHAFVLLDRSAGVGATNLGGLDTLYVADGSGTGGSATAVLRKFEWSGSTWVAQGTATMTAASSKLFGLTARVAANGAVELYATTAINSNNSLVTVTDASNSNAFGGALSGTLSVLASAGVNYAFRGVAFAPVTDLSISASAPANALASAAFNITLMATNNGPANAQNVGVQFTLPAGLSYLSASGSGFTASQSSGVVSFTGGSINAGSSATLTVAVKATTAGSYALVAGAALIDPSNTVEEYNEANNSSAAAAGTVVTNVPDLTVSVIAPVAPLTGPNGFDYMINVSNPGLAVATDVTVQFMLPPNGQTYASASGAGFTVSYSDGVVIFSGGTLASGASVPLTVRYTSLTNITLETPASAASVDPANAIVESDESNNTSAALLPVGVNTCDLTITNVHNGTFQAGDPAATYTLTVSNVGTGASNGLVTMNNTLPTGLTATSLTGTGWTIVQGTGSTVTATRSDALAAGASYPALTLTVDVEQSAPSSVTNHANVSGGGDWSPTNNSADEVTPIQGAGPGTLTLEKPPLGASCYYLEPGEQLVIPVHRTGGRSGVLRSNVELTIQGTGHPENISLETTQVEFRDRQTESSISLRLNLSTNKSPVGLFGVLLPGYDTVLVCGLAFDYTKPVISLQAPVAGSRINEGGATVKGTVSDNQVVMSFKYSLNNSAFVSPPGTSQPAKSHAFDTPLSPKPGVNTLVILASDYAGNTTQLTRAFTYVVKRPLTLNIASSVADGSVTISPNEPLNALELEKTYTLTAKPSAGRVFQHWSGTNISSAESTLKFTMKEGLVITASFLADPFTSRVAGEYNGLITADSGVTAGQSTNGSIKINVTPKGTFSGTVRIDGVQQSVSGFVSNHSISYIHDLRPSLPMGTLIFNIPPPAPDPHSLNLGVTHFITWLPPLPDNTDPIVGISRPNKPPYNLSLQMDLNPTGTHKITGTLEEQTPTGTKPLSIVDADRAAFDGKTPATTTVAATYTCALFGGTTNPTITPRGEGIGTITVTKDGKLRLVGSLSDGTALTCSVPMSSARTAALFAPLYASRGCFGARVALDEGQADSDLSSTECWWFRPFISGKLLPQGWPEGLTPQLIGAKYAVPTGESVLRDLDTAPSPNATLSFAEGGLTSRIEKPLTISKTNAITKFDTKDASFSAALTAVTGRLSGSFTHSDGTKSAFNAVVLQKGAIRGAFGYFVGSTLAGDARLSYIRLPRPTLVISEFMAKNVSSIFDEDGAHSDWIEIYNPGATDVDLTDWCLTDNDSNLTKWRFPAMTLNSKAFLIVWASGKNRRVPNLPLHTNFSLANQGEYLALVRPDGVTIEQEFAPTYPALRDDESYGVNFVGASLVSKGAPVRYAIPRNASLGTTWTAKTFNDASWRAGKTGIGFGVTIPGMTVRQVAATGDFGGVFSIATSTALLALPKGHASIASEATAIVPQLNLLGDGSDGHYEGNHSLPNGTAEPYALLATGFTTIPSAGNYVFGLNSDDGGRIKIDGNAVMTDDTNHGPEDHLSAPVNLSAGTHTIEVLMWEGGGGDEVELYAAPGTSKSWDDSFKLVGGPGGLSVSTLPLGASGVSPDVATNVQSLMKNINATCYVRLPFTASDVSTLSGLTLNIKYNDGFVAWLNGVEVARRNAPGALVFNSAATAAREITDALVADTIDLSSHLPLLVNGSNVLAVQALNDAASDSTFLVSPQLFATGILRSSTAVRFGPVDGGLTSTPGAQNERSQTLPPIEDTNFSVHRGFFSAPFTTAITTTTPGAQIRYTTDGSTPTATHGSVYKAPLRISRTTVLRAAAFKKGMTPTNVDTQSYVFLNDVIRQQPTGARPGTGWQVGTVNGQVSDYGMDPAIVNTANSTIGSAAKVKEALAALPTVSLVTDLPNLFDPATGIYSNPYARGFDWERPCSMEFIGDKGTVEGGFQINCGVRTRGGYSRSGDNPKHSFHIYFRSDYGKASLNYPLFGNTGTSTYQQIDLRTSQNYSWSFGGDGNNTFIREETARELQLAMGQPGSRDRYFHLYINGVYWGIYDFDERTEASFSSTYIGGNKSDYDVVKAEQDSGYVTGPTDGNLDAWQLLWDKAQAHATDPSNANYFALQGKAADGVTPTSDPVLLDVDNLIDYMLLTFWTGNLDGATSAFLGENAANNWFGSRDRTGANGGFRFFVHDFEHTFFNTQEDRTGPFASTNSNSFTYSNPMWIHHDLRPNAEYRMRWADRVQKHLFNDGALVASNVATRMQRRVAELDVPIIAESARWGDAKRAANEPPLTRLDWKNAVSYVINDYLPVRGAAVLQQLRDDGLYPATDAPTLSQFGGKIATGSEIIITGHGGTIYYTLDGADPRQLGGTVNPSAQVYTSASSTETLLPLNQTWKYLGDGSDQGTAWRAAAFDDSSWSSGVGEFGYGDGDEATVVPFVTTSGSKNATTYFRSSFTVTNAAQLTTATLRLKYDDAAIVYINGVEALRTGNIASDPAFIQYASGATPDESAFFDFSISPALLVDGSNTIAAEVHQADGSSSDISFSMSLSASRTNTASPLILATNGSHRLQVRALDGADWSALVDATFNVSALPDLRVAAVANGSFNAGDNGKTFTLNVSNTGTAATSGLVTVTDVLPDGLVATAFAGTGWTIIESTAQRVTATRSDALAAASSYPALTLTVNVTHTAPASVTTIATLSGGGEVNATNSTTSLSTPVTPVGASLFTFDESRYDVNEESGPLLVTILRSGSRTGAASVVLNTANGTARAPGDYGAVTNTTIDFADGEATKTVSIDIAADSASEANEAFTLKLSAPVNAALGTPATCTARILETDAVLPTITITAPAAGANVIARSVSITGKATDNKGVARVQLALNSGAFFDVPAAIASNGLSATYTAPIGASTGVNSVTARCYDTRGNVSALVTRTFTFTPLRPLALTITPDNSGTVALTTRADITKLIVGTSYTLKPTPKTGFLFDHWTTPTGSNPSPTLTFTMTEGLAITAVFVPNPFVAAVTGDYNGLVTNAPAVSRSNSNNGFVKIKPTALGSFTGTLKLDGDALPLIGQFKNDGTASITIHRTNKTPLILALTLDLNPTGTHQITGTVSDARLTGTVLLANVIADRAFFEGRTHIATAATHKVKVPAISDVSGEGLGTLTITRTGLATLTLKLADGSSLSTTAPLSEALTAPLFAALYSTRHGGFSVIPTISSPLPPNALLSSNALWFRPYLSSQTPSFGWPDGRQVQFVRY